MIKVHFGKYRWVFTCIQCSERVMVISVEIINISRWVRKGKSFSSMLALCSVYSMDYSFTYMCLFILFPFRIYFHLNIVALWLLVGRFLSPFEHHFLIFFQPFLIFWYWMHNNLLKISISERIITENNSQHHCRSKWIHWLPT